MISSTAKHANWFTSVFFTTWSATQQIDETFAVAFKTMIDFICRFSDKARESISYLYTCTHLTILVTTPITLVVYRLDLTMWSFIFLALR